MKPLTSTSAVLCLILAACLTACGGGGGDADPSPALQPSATITIDGATRRFEFEPAKSSTQGQVFAALKNSTASSGAPNGVGVNFDDNGAYLVYLDDSTGSYACATASYKQAHAALAGLATCPSGITLDTTQRKAVLDKVTLNGESGGSVVVSADLVWPAPATAASEQPGAQGSAQSGEPGEPGRESIIALDPNKLELGVSTTAVTAGSHDLTMVTAQQSDGVWELTAARSGGDLFQLHVIIADDTENSGDPEYVITFDDESGDYGCVSEAVAAKKEPDFASWPACNGAVSFNPEQGTLEFTTVTLQDKINGMTVSIKARGHLHWTPPAEQTEEQP